jgi:hypothetical protein
MIHKLIIGWTLIFIVIIVMIYFIISVYGLIDSLIIFSISLTASAIIFTGLYLIYNK